MENVLETPEAQKLLYLINLTYKSMKFCGGLDSNIYTKDINSQEQEDMIKSLALSEVRKLLGI